jgi:type VI secretion system protein ImpC
VEKTVDTPGGIPWTLLVGDLTFQATSRDAELLGRIGALAARAGAPFVAGGSPGLVGCATIADAADPADWQSPPDAEARAAWDALERVPQARFLGLALPRLLLRMPYGKATEPLERFAFEELTEDRPHESYLWGSAAFAVALLLAEAFDAEGWEMTGAHQEIDGLPFHVVRKDGQTSSKPCAEVVLTVRAYGRLVDSGLMPLLSFKDQDLVRLPTVQSIASPSAPLAGRWGGSS